jgi:uncharacterized protein (DUF2267 family)
MVVVAAVGAGAFVVRSPTVRRRTRRGLRQVTRWTRYESGRLEGVRYRMSGRHPDPDVYPTVLADRVRSTLGPLEQRFDVPRLHVMVEDHTVVLHGEVDDEHQASAIEDAVRHVPGVARVRSHIGIGLTPGDTRPSEGAVEHPSPALDGVLAAARAGGAARGSERAATRAVLSTFSQQLPRPARDHVLAHLPADLRRLAEPPRPDSGSHLRHVDEFVDATGVDPADPKRARAVTVSVLGALRTLVPEEIDGVAAVLPGDLRELWETGARR